MSSLSLSGLSSGLDTSAIVEQLMAVERNPQTLMKKNKAKEQSKLDRYRALNTKLQALQSAAQALNSSSMTLSPLSAKKASSSNTALFTASSDTTASAGTYSINVVQLAKEQKTGGGAYTASNGTLRIADSTGAYKDIALNSGMTASDVASAINNASAGMSATVINNQLMLTGKQTGETYTLSDTGGGSLVSNLGLGSNIQNAQQAQVVIDNTFTVNSKSNTITTALPGVTINAVATGTANLTVDRDTDAAVSKVKDFVTKFNDIVGQIKTDTKYDSSTKSGGLLLGDSFVQGLQAQLTQTLSNPFQYKDPNTGTYGTATGFENYTAVGISIQRDGTLALDETKLKNALNTDPAKAYALFAQEDGVTTTDMYGNTVKQNTNQDGIARRLDALVDSMISSSSLYNSSSGVSGGRYTGGMYTKIQSSENLLKDFDKRIDAYEDRLTMREKQLKNQFTAMEKAISALKSQGNYLASQLASSQASG